MTQDPDPKPIAARRAPPPEASLPEPDEFLPRGPAPWLIVLVVGVFVIAPGVVWWVTRGGGPEKTTYPFEETAAAPEANSSAGVLRLGLEELRTLAASAGPVAAMEAFDASLRPFRPSPQEWAYYISLAQDVGAIEAARAAIGELRGMDSDPLLQMAVELRQSAVECRPVEVARRAADLVVRPWPEAEVAGIAEQACLEALDLLLATGNDLAALRFLSDSASQRSARLGVRRAILLVETGQLPEAELALDRLENRLPGAMGAEGLRLRESIRWATGRDTDAAARWDDAWAAVDKGTAEALLLARGARWAGDLARAAIAYASLEDGASWVPPVTARVEGVRLLLLADRLADAVAAAASLERDYPEQLLPRMTALETRLLVEPAPDVVTLGRMAAPEQFPRVVALGRWRGADALGALDALGAGQVTDSSAALVLRTVLLAELGRAEETRLLAARARAAARLPLEQRWLATAGL